jgi:predicted N-acyltransferase
MNEKIDYVIRVLDSPLEVSGVNWNALLALQSPDGAVSPPGGSLNPFMRHEYLTAMHESGSATPKTGWTPRFITLWDGDTLAAGCALYLKDHSYGEYVFDHAWANAYHQHGLPYYPKALVAPPFTPVPGPRLLARNPAERLLLAKALIAWCEEEKLSSLHLLFNSDEDVKACEQAGMLMRHTVQFHWSNVAPTLVASRTALPLSSGEEANFPGGGPSENCLFKSFDDFLMSLAQEKRKKIRQERKKVADAGITFRWALGSDISSDDWDFFYKCYERTYYEHGNAPYLSRDFFQRMQDTMPENWLLFVAEHGEGEKKQRIATSLIAVKVAPTFGTDVSFLPPSRAELAGGGPSLRAHYQEEGEEGEEGEGQFDTPRQPENQVLTAYGRYWGALARVDCLHFEACYYQPLQWCIEHGVASFEGGAQGEHKMARALLPVKTTSAHWLAHPSFADAIERFLEREGSGINNYMQELEQRSPFRQT